MNTVVSTLSIIVQQVISLMFGIRIITDVLCNKRCVTFWLYACFLKKKKNLFLDETYSFSFFFTSNFWVRSEYAFCRSHEQETMTWKFFSTWSFFMATILICAFSADLSTVCTVCTLLGTGLYSFFHLKNWVPLLTIVTEWHSIFFKLSNTFRFRIWIFAFCNEIISYLKKTLSKLRRYGSSSS